MRLTSGSPFASVVSHAKRWQAEWEAELQSRQPLILCAADPVAARDELFAQRQAADAAVSAERRRCKPMSARKACPLEVASRQALRAIERRRKAAAKSERASAHDFALIFSPHNATFDGESNRGPAGLADPRRYVMPKSAVEKLADAEVRNRKAEEAAAAARKRPSSRAASGAPSRLTGPGIARQVLIAADRPMHVSLIASETIKRAAPHGLYNGKTPDQTIAAQLAVSAKRVDGVFVRTEPGCFGLREWTTAKLAKSAQRPEKPGKASDHAVANGAEASAAIEQAEAPETQKPARKRSGKSKPAAVKATVETGSKPQAVKPTVETGRTTPTAA